MTERALSLATVALTAWGIGLLIGRHATHRMDALTIEAQALQLAQERETSCAMARALVQQHEVVQHVWPQAPKPVAIMERCDAEGIGRALPAAFSWERR